MLHLIQAEELIQKRLEKAKALLRTVEVNRY